MVTIKLKGGLGNQLFQYAFGRYMSLIRTEKLFFDLSGFESGIETKREYSLDSFQLSNTINFSEDNHAISFIGKITKKILRKYNIGYDSRLLKSKKEYFEGFFQSYKYLEPIRDVILKDVDLKKSLEDIYPDLLNKINNSNSVSVHVRRGDYVNDAKTKSAHYTFGLEYYEASLKVINNMVELPVFFIFSDDIKWAEENLKINGEIIIVSNYVISDSEELMIMSKCKHNIIANSSFSFWGAWLNQNPNKIVIAPKKWNNIYVKEYKDLLPDNWIKI